MQVIDKLRRVIRNLGEGQALTRLGWRVENEPTDALELMRSRKEKQEVLVTRKSGTGKK